MTTLIAPDYTTQAEEVPGPDFWPVVGQWYWVISTDEDDAGTECLMCCNHTGTNHAQFSVSNGKWGLTDIVMDVDMPTRLRLAPDWKKIFSDRIEAGQTALRAAIELLADQCKEANLLHTDNAPASPLAMVTRADPLQQKANLITLRDSTIPETKKEVDELTKEIVANYQNLILPEKIHAEKVTGAVKGVEDQLFALELYAGFEEQVKQIAEGEPPPHDTPITIRQMLRYMDEETLIDAEDGGMDFTRLEQFDQWAVRHINEVAPEPRCIVAFKIRRHMKDYGRCDSLSQALMHFRFHEKNTCTYLLLRNGQQIFRISTLLDFEPRLLPFRAEFEKPLCDQRFGKNSKIITPRDYKYDDAVKERANTMRHYNRMIFIIQGLLDRSKVFSPHPRITLANPDHAMQWVKPNYDEEDGLPTSDVPQWELYQATLNAALKPGSIVWAKWEGKYNHRENYRERHEGYFRVQKISRTRLTAVISEPWGPRHGYQFPKERWNKGEWGEWPVNRRRLHTIKMEEMINVEAYEVGGYKRFLCDATTKGKYLKWAPFLLKAERFHKMNPEQKAEI